jgi:hypothetical protein
VFIILIYVENLCLDKKLFENISLELALNSRVSTGGWKGVEKAGETEKNKLSKHQIEFIFWCLAHTPKISERKVIIKCDGKKFNDLNITLNGESLNLKPREYSDVKCPSIRLNWVTDKKTLNTRATKISFSTIRENSYFIERGMGQQMVHIAGAISQAGVCILGGVNVDIVPMVKYMTKKAPNNFLKGNMFEPIRGGNNSARKLIEDWKSTKNFQSKPINLSHLGQICWAGLGCTPHKTYRYHRFKELDYSGQGKTIPSAAAIYGTRIYIIRKDGIYRYVNWNEEKCCSTHSLSKIRKGENIKIGEFKRGAWTYTGKTILKEEIIRNAPQIPESNTHVLIASNGRLTPYWALMEGGYSILNIILQAQALNISSRISTLSQNQSKKIQNAIGLIDFPIAVLSLGYS